MKFYKDMIIILSDKETDELNARINTFIDALVIKHIAERFNVSILDALRMSEPLDQIEFTGIFSTVRIFENETNKDSKGFSDFGSANELDDIDTIIYQHVLCCELLKKELENNVDNSEQDI